MELEVSENATEDSTTEDCDKCIDTVGGAGTPGDKACHGDRGGTAGTAKDNCALYRRIGYCASNSWVKNTVCRRTCGTCSGWSSFALGAHLAAVCPSGQAVANKEECQAAYDAVNAAGEFVHPAKRNMQVGSWNGVPMGCSVQFSGSHVDSNGDQSPHWNTIAASDNHRATSGEFRMLCRLGEARAPLREIEEPDIPAEDLAKILSWIKTKTTEARLPFCWRQSEGRGVGTIPGRMADCPRGYYNHGATCHRPAHSILAGSRVAYCPSGYTNMGLTCYRGPDTYGKCCTVAWSACPCSRPGYTNFGCTCTRGAHSMGMDSMTCPDGYFRSSITARCHKHCPPGYANTGETCYRGPHTMGLSSMRCKHGEHRIAGRCFPNDHSGCFGGKEQQHGLCYKKCPKHFHGVGPVCWQDCPTNWAECAAGCAQTSAECAMTVVDQVLAPLVVAANVATIGMSSSAGTAAKAATASTKTISIGGKVLSATKKVGLKAIKLLQTVQTAPKATTTVKVTTYAAKAGRSAWANRKTITKTVKVGGKVYDDIQDYETAYAEDFEGQTSKEINDEINEHFHPDAAGFIKRKWGEIQLTEMAETNGWTAAQSALQMVAIVDITGVTGLVSAYAKPVCQDHSKLPCLESIMTKC